MIRVVLDTNVVVSAFLSPHGAPAQVVAAFRQESFDVVVSEPILGEYRRALSYDRVRKLHQMSDDELDEVVEGFRRAAIVVEPGVSLDVVAHDPDDNKFVECAVSGGASYIISGDPHLQNVGEYRGIRMVSPPVFLSLLTQDLV